MKILWSEFAAGELRDIFNYYKENAGLTIAKKLRDNIFSSTQQIKNQPKSGQIEQTLSKLDEEYRYLIRGNYKVIYKKVKEGILITDIFDTRQDPKKVNNPGRKTRGY